MTFKCGESIGFVIFDCICLMLGAASLRSAATAEVAGEMAVIGAWLGSLTLGNKILYAATALTTIVAAVATDGVAEIGLIGLELATAGWLISDSIKCAEACEF